MNGDKADTMARRVLDVFETSNPVQMHVLAMKLAEALVAADSGKFEVINLNVRRSHTGLHDVLFLGSKSEAVAYAKGCADGNSGSYSLNCVVKCGDLIVHPDERFGEEVP